MRKPRTIQSRRLATALLATVAVLLFGATAALAASPSVHLTRYSPTVSGNIGSATAGVNVTVALLRAGTTVDTAPVATTNASGEWTAEFGTHVPSDALDVLNVKYSGTGAPPEATYGDGNDTEAKPGLGFFEQGISIAASGESGGALCTNFAAAKCATLTAHVAYSGGGSAEVAGTPDEADEEIEEFAFSPAVGANDEVTVTASFAEENGSTLELTVPTPMLGVGDVFAGQGTTAPRCTADLVTLAVSCAPLATGNYSLTQTRGATDLGSHSATVTSGGESASFTLGSLQAADQLVLSVSGAGGRVLTTEHVSQLVVHEAETLSFGSASATVTGGSCQADEWFGVLGGAGLCPSSGVVPASSPPALEDENSGGSTTATPPLMSYTSPMDGEDVFGSTLVAFAELNTGGSTAVTLSATPVGGGSAIPASGNPNSASGATLAGLTAGKRYAATWGLTDANADAVTLTTHFNDQTGGATEGSPGKEGAPGKEGVAGREGPVGKTGAQGAAGAEGKQGPAGEAAEIVCTTKKVKVVVNQNPHMKTKTTCVVKHLAVGATITTTSLMLSRGQVVYAVGHAKAKAARVTMRDLRAVPPGAYTLTIVTQRRHTHTTVRYRVDVAGGQS